MSYVALKNKDKELWTVGFYKPDGTWEAESDHGTMEQAAGRLSYLNGGGSQRLAANVALASGILVGLCQLWRSGERQAIIPKDRKELLDACLHLDKAVRS